MSEDEVIRLARPSDLRRLAGIQSTGTVLFREHFGDETPPALTAAPPTGAERDGVGFLLVATVGRALVGFVHVVDLDGDAHLEQLSVLPAHGRRGIGTRLARAAMEEARWAGYSSMSLTTYRDVPWNGPFYRSLGFEEVAAPTSEQQRVRDRETELGLDDCGVRIVMARPLTRPDRP